MTQYIIRTDFYTRIFIAHLFTTDTPLRKYIFFWQTRKNKYILGSVSTQEDKKHSCESFVIQATCLARIVLGCTLAKAVLVLHFSKFETSFDELTIGKSRLEAPVSVGFKLLPILSAFAGPTYRYELSKENDNY